MSGTRKMLIAALVGLAVLTVVPAVAQYSNQGQNDDRNDSGWRDRDNNNRDERDANPNFRNGSYSSESQNKAYRKGAADAQWELRHGQKQRNRNWRNDDDAQAYRDGYNNIMYAANDDRENGQRDHRRDSNGAYGSTDSGYGYQNYGARMGYQDGQHTGQLDAQNRERSRPTEWRGYKDADHGFGQSRMNKAEFQSSYRQAYIAGYQRAYNQYRR